jgi:2,3,4,5-tetrahydropyridine-2-carboxylate N-succinyltransferase
MTQQFALGFGVGTQNQKGEWLEVFYPAPLFQPSAAIVDSVRATLGYTGDNTAIQLDNGKLQTLAQQLRAAGEAAQADLLLQLQDSTQPRVATLLATDSTPTSVPEAYLKLHLLSHRLVKPHGIALAGIFGVLPNVAWTNQGAIDLGELPARQLQARLRGELLEVMSVDKFPKMTNYVVPSGVRVAHTARRSERRLRQL